MKRFFVLGSGIEYSLSPKIYRCLFEQFGDDAIYSILDVADLRDNTDKIFDSDGFNVTKPFKREIVQYLDRDLSGCGSVNTVTTFDKTGYSTDGRGFLYDLERNFTGASSSSVLIIGYGGAATACVSALKGRASEIYVTGRDEDKTREFSHTYGIKRFNGEKVDGVISCVTQTYRIDLRYKPSFCYDLRYVGKMLEYDCPCANGIGMLIAQAIYSYSIFMQKRFDKSDVDRLYLKLREIL